MLLPKESLPLEELDPEEEKFILTQKLVEYSFYKDVAQRLKELEGDSGKYLMRTSAIYIERESMQTEDPYRMANAFFSALERDTEKPMKFEKDIVDVSDVIVKIKALILEKQKLFWTDIVKTCASRREVVISFLSVLELMRLAIVRAMQAETFGEIVIEQAEQGAANG
jgi:segregation and condensation protein A